MATSAPEGHLIASPGALLNHFWRKLKKHESLIFYYCNRGNAVNDEVPRMLVGVSRIVDIGDQRYFGKRADKPGNFPIWSQRITNANPKQGVRIPYQELSVDRIPSICRINKVKDGVTMLRHFRHLLILLLEAVFATHGHWPAFTAGLHGRLMLWIRELDSLDAKPLPGTDSCP